MDKSSAVYGQFGTSGGASTTVVPEGYKDVTLIEEGGGEEGGGEEGGGEPTPEP